MVKRISDYSALKVAFVPRAVLATALLLCAVSTAAAQAAPPVAEILRRLEANQVFETSRMEARLEASNRFGVTTSDFTAWSRRGGDTLLEITSGPDRGQKVLRQKTNIYLYYPDADEVIWLRGSALRDSLMGSDFSYEDLTDDRTILDRFDAELTGSEVIDGAACWTIRLTAKSRSETYARQDIWVDKEQFVTRRAILYSAAGRPLREMQSSDIRIVSGRPMAFKTVMTDLLRRNTGTTMTLLSVEINQSLNERMFSREALSW